MTSNLNFNSYFQDSYLDWVSPGGVYSAEHGTGKRKRSDFVECFGNNGVQQVLEAKSNVDPHFLLNRGNIIEV